MKISILLAIHNDESTLEKCLDSIKNQSFKDFEVIVVDDNSKDNSLSLLQSWSKKKKFPLKLISNKKNIGLTKSLNKGLKECKGTYVARLDADDWWEKDKLQIQISFLKKNPVYGYIGCYYINHFQSSGSSAKKMDYVSDEDIRKYKFKKNPFAHSCLMIKKDLLDKISGYDETVYYGQDYNLFMRCLPHTKFHTIPEFLCHRLVKKTSISILKQKDQALQSMRTRRIFMKKYGSSLRDQIYLIEPFLNAYTPLWIKKIKRKFL